MYLARKHKVAAGARICCPATMSPLGRLLGRGSSARSTDHSADMTPYRNEHEPAEREVNSISTGVVNNAQQLQSNESGLGMKIISTSDQAKAIILLCHGLTGDREGTFTHANGKFWPKDFLSANIPDATIVTFGYDANAVGLRHMASSDTLRGHGKSLVQALESLHSEPALPIIIIAHSLGGLVAEQAYLLALNDPELSVGRNIRGMIFLGTPHYGSDLARWGSLLSRLTNIFRRTNGSIVRDLQPEAEILKAVEEDFMTQITKRPNPPKIFCFYEGLAVTGIGKVVSEDSAIIKGYSNCSIHANHMDMVKFDCEANADYVNVRTVLKKWVVSSCTETASLAGAKGQASANAASTESGVNPVTMNFGGTINSEKTVQGVNFSGTGNDNRFSM